MSERFSEELLADFQKNKILGMRAGTEHRFIGLWVVVAEGRVFVRSWSLSPQGWYAAFQRKPHGTVQIGEYVLPIRAVRIRSERVKAAVDEAYRQKYNMPGARQYVQDLTGEKSRAATVELVPVQAGSS